MIDKINYYVKRNIPFLFIVDFDIKNPVIIPISEAKKEKIYYWINGKTNIEPNEYLPKKINIKKYPIPYEKYKAGFDVVKENLINGNSYLVNLTFPTKIELNLSLAEIFFISKAKYKLLFKDKFVLFSPETFIKISNRKIYSYPMKGTIDADIPNAEKIILSDEKEAAEHITIVDLIRNDIGLVSKNVNVEKYRYIDKIFTSGKNLLQVSSIITGELYPDYQKNLGNIIFNQLPAGSITGAPKKKTVEIIKEAERYDRGYYTGVFGYYDNNYLESAVMIRFIEAQNEGFFYKSGGGITVYSDPQKEYQEMLDKVYVPIH